MNLPFASWKVQICQIEYIFEFYINLHWFSEFAKYICALIFVATITSSNCAELEEFICFGKPTDTLLPHPTECNAFFLCDGGVGFKKTCPEKSFFNPKRNECDPNYEDCNSPGDTTTPDENSSSVAPTLQPTNLPTLSTENPLRPTTTTKAPLRCPTEDTNDLTFLPSRERCDEFYLCYYGKPILFQCAVGYHYSESEKGCMLPDEAKCKVGIHIRMKYISITHEFPFYTSIQINNPDSSSDLHCPKLGRRFLPYAEDCENFLYCENGHKTIQRCQPFYHWDIQHKRCILMTRAVCIQSIPMPLQRMFYWFFFYSLLIFWKTFYCFLVCSFV